MHTNSSTKQIKLLTSALAATIFALPLLAADQPNTFTEKEQAAGWQLLFNGKDLTGWRAYKTPEGPGQIGAGWTVEDGLLKKRAGVKGGDIITEQQFDNFELMWEWRIEPGANNGVKYLVTEARPGAPGQEYQMLDDESDRWNKLPAKDKPSTLPKDAQLIWDAAKHCVTLPGAKMSLIPINDVIDWNYQVNTYNRQMLWK